MTARRNPWCLTIPSKRAVIAAYAMCGVLDSHLVAG